MEKDQQFEVRAAAFITDFDRVRAEIGRVIVGQQSLVLDVLTALCGGGHVLLEGVPGIGKTMLVHTLADVVDSHFARIQFTPDLMPSDILGTRMVHEDEHGARHFTFQKGPVFTQVLLADEINRATPKTQSALLEAMQERSVTVAGETMILDRPFFVIATQNPLEMEGTYPLPEAQLDRFLFKLHVDFPSVEELVEVGRRTTGSASPKAGNAITAAALCDHMETVRAVPVADPVEFFAAEILVRSHPNHAQAPDLVKRYVKYGASPRGLQAMLLGAKVRALLDGRYHVAEADVTAVALQSLRHRLIMNFEGEAESIETDAIIQEIITSVSTGAAVGA